MRGFRQTDDFLARQRTMWESSSSCNRRETRTLQPGMSPLRAPGDMQRRRRLTRFFLCGLWYRAAVDAAACFSCDGDTHMELRCPDPAGHGVLLSGRHSGVRPVEQLQRKVSGEDETFLLWPVVFFPPNHSFNFFFFSFLTIYCYTLYKRLILIASVHPKSICLIKWLFWPFKHPKTSSIKPPTSKYKGVLNIK